MAIDKNKIKDLLSGLERLFDQVVGHLPKEATDRIRKLVLGQARQEIKELIEDARPPVLYLLGRSGHGKSSLINALANRPVAEVGHVKPTTPVSTPYTINFEGLHAAWQVIDSRGIFETTRPDGAPARGAVEHVHKDIVEHRPDVILHLVAAPEVRNLANDLKVLWSILASLKEKMGAVPPVVVVLTKADTLGNPRHWPPEAHPAKAALLGQLIDYMSADVLQARACTPYRPGEPVLGCKMEGDSPVLFVVPVAVPADEEPWNVETLSEIIGEVLPRDARLEFFQAQRRKELLRKLSSALIHRFAGIAWTVGLTPLPIADIIILTPLQLLMVALVGGLSCRPLSLDTAKEFAAASGVTIGAGTGLRVVAQELVKLVPWGGSVISAGIAASGTYAIGKSAEAYFFFDRKQRPEELKVEWKPEQGLIGGDGPEAQP